MGTQHSNISIYRCTCLPKYHGVHSMIVCLAADSSSLSMTSYCWACFSITGGDSINNNHEPVMLENKCISNTRILCIRSSCVGNTKSSSSHPSICCIVAYLYIAAYPSVYHYTSPTPMNSSLSSVHDSYSYYS